jgi:RNA polymerase sigma-70 factor (ECF subfamily)
MTAQQEVEFRRFLLEVEPRLHRALVAGLGWERGREATAEALAYAWEHWSAVSRYDNPAGYLFRVGQSKVRRRKVRILFERPDHPDWQVEPALARLLAELPERQRLAVVLVHAYGWTPSEVADLAGLSLSTVQTHLSRGLKRLRASLEVIDHA